MFPPIFALAVASSAVTSLLDTAPTRFWPFGEAPQDETRPYAVWQTIYGSPENYLGQRPDIDSWGVQVDAYAPTATGARNVARALRDALEGQAHVVAWNGEMKDEPTGLYRYSFSVEFWAAR